MSALLSQKKEGKQRQMAYVIYLSASLGKGMDHMRDNCLLPFVP